MINDYGSRVPCGRLQAGKLTKATIIIQDSLGSRIDSTTDLPFRCDVMSQLVCGVLKIGCVWKYCVGWPKKTRFGGHMAIVSDSI